MSRNQISLMVLAAGMGSRYGGLKQLDPIGPGGQKIIDYTVYDALKAGFNKINFVIRKSFEKDFQREISDRWKEQVEIEHVFQEISPDIVGVGKIKREKPWGTGHAMLTAMEVIDEPFAVVNADDYYGAEPLKKLADFLREEATPEIHAMVGYVLKNTLSENGTVSRGICQVNASGDLISIEEHKNVERDPSGTVAVHETMGKKGELPLDSTVSMNLFGFHPAILEEFKWQFKTFAEENRDNPRAEFYIPLPLDKLIQQGKISLKVIPTNARWHGVTYREDKPLVKQAFQQMTDQGVYPEKMG